MKKSLIILFLLLSSIYVYADEDFTEARRLVDSGISCGKLTDDQLELMGDYYMEQIHPGRQHEIMDDMMGGEGSESLRQTHILMARRLYCNEDISIGYYPMMSRGGMMSGVYGGYGMMGGFNTGYGYYSFNNFLLTILFIALIVLAVLWIIKVSKGIKK